MDSMSGRSSNDQLGDQSLGSTNGRYSVQIHGDPLDPLLSHHRAFSYISSHLTSSSMANLPQPQQTMQMPGLPVNNTSDGNGALSLSLFGDLAKVVGLLGNNNNNNNNGGYLGSTLGLNPQIEQQLRALGLHPSQYPSAGVSQTQSSSRGGDSGEDMSSKYSFSTRGQGGSSVSVQSGGRNKKPNRIVVVPCRARGMSMEHNFQVSQIAGLRFSPICLLVTSSFYVDGTLRRPILKFPRTLIMAMALFAVFQNAEIVV